jgi:hypothetical protein
MQKNWGQLLLLVIRMILGFKQLRSTVSTSEVAGEQCINIRFSVSKLQKGDERIDKPGQVSIGANSNGSELLSPCSSTNDATVQILHVSGRTLSRALFQDADRGRQQSTCH